MSRLTEIRDEVLRRHVRSAEAGADGDDVAIASAIEDFFETAKGIDAPIGRPRDEVRFAAISQRYLDGASWLDIAAEFGYASEKAANNSFLVGLRKRGLRTHVRQVRVIEPVDGVS